MRDMWSNHKKWFSTILLLVLMTSVVIQADDWLAKGPEPEELYIVCPDFDNYEYGLALYHSVDFGSTLTLISDSLDLNRITADSTPGGIYYQDGSVPGKLYYSTNYGSDWDLKNNDVQVSLTSGRVPGEIWNSLRFSLDYGETFQYLSLSGLYGWGIDLSVGHQDGEVYALMYESQVTNGLLFRSIDYGDTFRLQSQLTTAPFMQLRRGAVSGELYIFDPSSRYLYYSSDYGASFAYKYSFHQFDPYDWFFDMVGGREPGDVFVSISRASSFDGPEMVYIYYSNDYGETFTEFNPINGEVGAVDKEEDTLIINGFELYQNHPNPFNVMTTIQYRIDNSIGNTVVDLSILNIGGRVIRKLMNGVKQPGLYQIVWDGKNKDGVDVASGNYLLQIRIQDKLITKKMLLIR